MADEIDATAWDLDHLETARLMLRPPVYADGPHLHAILADPVVCRYSPNRVVSDPALTQLAIADWHERRDTGLHTYVIAMRGDRAHAIGLISVGPDQEVGGVLSPGVSGRGLASEALRAVMAAHGLRRAWTIVDAEHTALIRTLGRVGIVVERRLATFRVHPQISDRKRDCVLLRQQFPSTSASAPVPS